MEKKKLDEIIEKAVGQVIKKDMEMVSRAFYTVITKYSFLFDGDNIETQKMLINTCFSLQQPVIEMPKNNSEEEERIYFDMSVLLKSIPQSVKEDLYKRILDQFINKIEIADLQNKQEGEQ